MNTSEPTNECATTLATLEDHVRENPVSTLLMIAGVGVAAVLIARALAPTPQSRAMQLLEDIQERLADFADDSAESFNDLHLDRSLSKVGRRIKGLFS